MGTGEADDVVSGRSNDRQWAVFMSASGQLRGRLRAVSRGRRQRGRGNGERTRGAEVLLGEGVLVAPNDGAALMAATSTAPTPVARTR